jgi:hypothetical protein
MSMAPEQEDFEALRRLLAIKRHEQPPPGYFNSFSRQVLARIEAGEGDGRFGRLPWYQRLWAALDTKPALAGALGATACAAVIGAFLYSDNMTSGASGGLGAALGQPMTGFETPAFRAMYSPQSAAPSALATVPADSIVPATLLPQEQLANSLFDSVQLPHPEAVSWTPPGGN